MMDNVSPERRSEIMGLVKHFDTPAEIVVRRVLHRLGLRFRLHRKDLPGRPDLTLPKWRTAVFIHGCFWHRHPGCPRTRTPKTRVDFWVAKFERNVRRDRAAARDLRKGGWRVVVVWECETTNVDRLTRRLRRCFQAAGLESPSTVPSSDANRRSSASMSQTERSMGSTNRRRPRAVVP